MTFKFFLLIPVLFFYSCKNDHKVIKEYDEKGKLKWEIPMTSDHKKDGILIEYFPDGTKKHEIEYKANIKNGINVGYYENGKVEYKGYYINGKKDSVWTYYYDSGEKEQVENWLLGHIYGETMSYFKNSQLKEYKLFTYGDDLLYRVEFNNGGAIIKEVGQFCFVIYNRNDLKNKDTAEVKICIGLPKIYDCSVLVKKMNKISSDTVYYHVGYNSLPHSRFHHMVKVRVPCESHKDFSIVLSVNKLGGKSIVTYKDTVEFHIR